MTITTKAGLDAAQKSRIQFQSTAVMNASGAAWRCNMLVPQSSMLESDTGLVAATPASINGPPTGGTGGDGTLYSNGSNSFIKYPAINAHIAAINCAGQAPTTQGTLCALYDIVWIGGGMNASALGNIGQVNSFPALTRPDSNGTGLEILLLNTSAAAGPASTTFTASYTNQAGVAGRTATATFGATTLLNVVGAVFPLSLQQGDTGVQSIQTVTHTAGNGGSVLWAMLGRRICDFSLAMNASEEANYDYLSLGLPEIGDSAALAIIAMTSGNAGPASQMIELVLAHG